MDAMASQIAGVSIVSKTVYSGEDQRKHQRCASLAFVRGIHRWPVNSPHKGTGTRKMFSCDDVTMIKFLCKTRWCTRSYDKQYSLWNNFNNQSRIILFREVHQPIHSFLWVFYCLSQFIGATCSLRKQLTHWGRVTHICVSKLIIIGSDNGLSPSRHQSIIWTNAGILLIGPLGTNFSEILTEIYTFSFKRMYLKMPSAKWRPFCLGLNVLINWTTLLTPQNNIF